MNKVINWYIETIIYNFLKKIESKKCIVLLSIGFIFNISTMGQRKPFINQVICLSWLSFNYNKNQYVRQFFNWKINPDFLWKYSSRYCCHWHWFRQ